MSASPPRFRPFEYHSVSTTLAGRTGKRNRFLGVHTTGGITGIGPGPRRETATTATPPVTRTKPANWESEKVSAKTRKAQRTVSAGSRTNNIDDSQASIFGNT